MSYDNKGFKVVENMLAKQNFVDAQKRFDTLYNENKKALVIHGFLEHLLQNIRQRKESIANREWYRDEFQPTLIPKDEYQEKLFSLDDKVTTLVIDDNEQELTAYDTLFKKVKTDGSNICYCVWLYNKGDFRTREEKEWAEELKEYYDSGLRDIDSKAILIRLIVCIVIFCLPILFAFLGCILMVLPIILPSPFDDYHEKFTRFCSVFTFGLLYTGTLIPILSGVVSILIYLISGLIYNLCTLSKRRKLNNLKSKDIGFSYLMAATITSVGAVKLSRRKK